MTLVSLTEAVDVIFVASGIACGAMVDLIHARGEYVSLYPPEKY